VNNERIRQRNPTIFLTPGSCMFEIFSSSAYPMRHKGVQSNNNHSQNEDLL
jgi:hypothetical protein